MLTSLQAAKAMYTAYALGDTPGLSDVIDPAVYATIPGDPALLPWAGFWEGIDGARRFHQRIKDHTHVHEYVVRRYEVHGDVVLAFCWERVTFKPTGKTFESEHVGIVTVRDGKVVRYLEYGDTAKMEAAAVGWEAAV